MVFIFSHNDPFHRFISGHATYWNIILLGFCYDATLCAPQKRFVGYMQCPALWTIYAKSFLFHVVGGRSMSHMRKYITSGCSLLLIPPIAGYQRSADDREDIHIDYYVLRRLILREGNWGRQLISPLQRRRG